uniref:Uncharacterized protein n=1 Tax=Gopherus agassizii TaxID=38772 RepID=A0A452GRW8_9SAUR
RQYGGALTQSSSPSFSCLFIIWKRKTSFPKIFFLLQQKKLLLLKVRLSLQQSLNPSA